MSMHDSVQMFNDLKYVNVNILLYMLNLCQKKEKKRGMKHKEVFKQS